MIKDFLEKFRSWLKIVNCEFIKFWVNKFNFLNMILEFLNYWCKTYFSKKGMLIAQTLIEHNQKRFFCVLLNVDSVYIYMNCSCMFKYGVRYGSRSYFGKYGLRVVFLNSWCNFSFLTSLSSYVQMRFPNVIFSFSFRKILSLAWGNLG